MQIEDLTQVKNFLLAYQDKLCATLVSEEKVGINFHEDTWEQAGRGSGRTRVIANGAVFEKGGVNFSHVYGKNLPTAALPQERKQLAGCDFQAMGVSVVIHPNNPYAPTSHLNVRCFAALKEQQPVAWWFGGGFDLTPYYGFTEDCQHWHRMAKAACDPFGPEIYPRYKKECDEYFFLKHRQEPRGIGGLFFDELNHWEFAQCFAFMQSVAEHYILAYQPIIARRKHHPYGVREKDFQCYRRTRYVEFNLIYDRGTLFGLQFGGRTESILVSMPPQANWRYNWQPEPGSEEAKLYENFLVAKDWVK